MTNSFQFSSWVVMNNKMSDSLRKLNTQHNNEHYNTEDSKRYDCKLLNLIITKEELFFVTDVINKAFGNEYNEIVIDSERKKLLYNHLSGFDGKLLNFGDTGNTDILNNFANGVKNETYRNIDDEMEVLLFDCNIKDTFDLSKSKSKGNNSRVSIFSMDDIMDINEDLLNFSFNEVCFECKNASIELIESIDSEK